MVLLIGLAVGIDYSMFYLKRARQERAAGRSERAALEAAAATSGRSVLISGLTVIVAMAGMFLTGDKTFASLAFATILVVAVAVLGSLTVLPAVLSRLGDKVDRLRVPFVGRLRRDDGEGRIWGAIVDRVLRRPALSAAARRRVAAGARRAGAAAAARASGDRVVPAVARGDQDVRPDAAGVPRLGAARQCRRQGAERAHAGGARRRSRELEQRALASGRAFEPITVDVNRRAPSRTSPSRSQATAPTPPRTPRFRVLRETIVPETVGAVPNTRGRRHRADRRVERPGRQAEVQPAAGRRVRPPASRSC